MPRIKVIVEDDNGLPLTDTAECIYVLEGSCETLDDIDEAVERFKNTALPDVEKLLLQQTQKQFVADPLKRGTIS